MEELLRSLGYSDEDIKKVIEGMKENKIYTSKEENMDERYSKLKQQKIDLETELQTVNDTVATLKKDNKDNEELQKTIKAHETTIETLKTDAEAKIKNLTFDNAITSKLAKVDDKYKKLLIKEFDREKLVIKEDGSIEGLEEQFKTISETYTEWFEPANPGSPGFNPGGAGNGIKNPWSKEHFNLTEQARILRENPSLAMQFKNSK
jgi:DNA-directed RNA polymerase beta subunit